MNADDLGYGVGICCQLGIPAIAAYIEQPFIAYLWFISIIAFLFGYHTRKKED